MRYMISALAAVALASGTFPAIAQDAPPPGATAAKPGAAPLTAESLLQRYESLGHLVEHSASSKQIEATGNLEAVAERERAREARSKAKEAVDGGRLPEADRLLREAAQHMMKATRLASPKDIGRNKERVDYDRRLQSTKALLATGKRVAGEKASATPEFGKAETLMQEADVLAAEGKTPEARQRLDAAYGLVTGALRNLRAGEELKAEKKFSTPADEYAYEQARNDDYLQLAATYSGDGADPQVVDLARKAKTLRGDADALAKGGDHRAALTKIQESTSQAKSILRRAGIPIM